MRSSITRAMPLAVALAMAAVLSAPTAAEGQARPTRNLIVDYTPGGPSQNGYMDAQQAVTYWFQECAEGVGFVAQYSPTVHMVVYPHRYWVNGRQVQVPSQFSAPPAPKPTLKGTIRGNGIAKEVTYLYASRDANCWNNGIILGPKSQFWAAKATDAEKARVLADFGFDLQANLPALRNSDVENHFRNLFAAERRDSAQKVAAARADSMQRARRADSVSRARVAQTRRDSIERADAARRQAAGTGSASSRPSSGGAASSGAGGAASSGAGTGSSAGSSQAARERQAEAERQRAKEAEEARVRNAEEQRQADEEMARVAEANRREKAIQDSIATEQLVQATAEAAMIIGAGIGKVIEGLEGTGLAIGASYSMGYFEGETGLIGFTITGHMDGFIAPFFEFAFPIGDKTLSTERSTFGGIVGSVIPRTSFSFLGSMWQPHIGINFLSTEEQIHEFNSELRTRSLLMVGLTRKAQNILRIDATIYSGSPRLGFALAHAF